MGGWHAAIDRARGLPGAASAVLRREWAEHTGETVNLYFRGGAVAAVVGCCEAGLLALAFVGRVATVVLLGWLAAFVAIRAVRLALAWHYRRHGPAHPPRYWSRCMFGTMVAQALSWGAASLVLVTPDEPLPELVLHFALMGVAGSATHFFSAYPVLVAYALGVLSPLVLRDLWLGGWHLLLAVYPLLVLYYVLRNGWRQSRVHHEAVAQRRRNAELIVALHEQNAISTEARALAEQAHDAKVRFFAAASHDLRQPLHALGLYAQAMRRPDASADVRALSAHIADCVDGMSHIVDELLELSQLDAGRVEPQPAPVALARLLREAAAMHEGSAQAKGLALHVALGDAADAVVLTDAQQLRRVLANLLSNALRYTPRGEVRIEAWRERDAVTVAVADTGIGIEPEELPRVFEEFFQVGNAARDRTHGHGLGLAIVKRLSDLLDLRVTVVSTPGAGSRFSLRLPLADPAGGEQAGTDTLAADGVVPSPDLLHGRRVLLVEDDKASRDAMALLLRQWGCEVGPVASADAAVAMVDEGWRPDFLIADLRLGGGDDGCGAAQRLRARLGTALPALLVTGDADDSAEGRARDAALVLLHKPVKPARLRAYMNRVFADSGTAAADPAATSP